MRTPVIVIAALIAQGVTAALAAQVPTAARDTTGRRVFSAQAIVIDTTTPRAFPAPTDSVTLDEAIRLSLEHSPAMVQSEGNVRTARWGERTAIGSFLPSLSMSTSAALNSTERFNSQTNTTVSGSQDSYSAGLSASMDIFTGFRRGAELSQAKAETQAARASLLEQRFAVTLSAKQTFFDVLQGEELIQVARSRLQNARAGLQAAQRRADVGTATRSDVLRSQLELTTAQKALLEAQTTRNSAAYKLGQLVGENGPVGAESTELAEPEPLVLADSALMDIVLHQAPTVVTAEASLKAARSGVGAARSQYLPSLRLSSGYDWFNETPAFSGARGSWSVRLGLSYPIFNGLQREQASARASIQADVADAQLEDARRGARTQLNDLLAALHLAEEQVSLSKQSLTVAEEDLRVQEERYRLGASTILDRITSQVNLVQAQTDLVTAKHAYQIARAQLEALVGREL